VFREIKRFEEGRHASMWDEAFNEYRDTLLNFFARCDKIE
jgi:hypothetical protein